MQPSTSQSHLQETSSSTVNRRAIAFIFLTVCLDLLSAGILVPVIPFLVGQFNQDALMVGLLALSFYAAQFIATPILGNLSDRVGRRPILVLSVLGTGIGYFLFGFANALWLLFAARLLDGFTGGNISVAQAYIADISSPQDRAKNFGLLGAAFGLGFILGPALGGWLSQISWQTPALVAGCLSLITTAFGYFVLPESLPPKRRCREPIALKQLNPFRQIGDALRRPSLRRFLLASFAQNVAFSGLQTNFALYTFVRFNLGPAQNGGLFAYIGFIAALMQGLIIRRLVKQFDERQLMIAGLGLMVLGYVSIALVPAAWGLYPAMTLLGVGSGMSTPTLTGALSKQVSPHEQGGVLGAAQALSSLALIVGPVWAGFIFDHWGATTPYWSGALAMVVATLFIAGGGRSPKHNWS